MFGVKTRVMKVFRRVSVVDLAGPNVVYLAGSGRSGTTWIQELINYRKDYRIVFEPFNSDFVAASKHLVNPLFLRPSCRDPELTHPIEQIIEGKVYADHWTDVYNQPGIYRRRIIKEIRTNLLLGWLRRRYPEMPIIFMIRHPIPVVLSQSKLGEQDSSWTRSLDRFFGHPELVADFLSPFRDVVQQCQDQLDHKIVTWCIENFIPLRQLRSDEVHLAFYEDFLTEPQREVDRLFGYLGRTVDSQALSQLKKPSDLSRAHSAALTGEDPLRAWCRRTSPEIVQRTMRWLSVFGLDAIYCEDPLPNSQKAFEMLAVNPGVSADVEQASGEVNHQAGLAG